MDQLKIDVQGIQPPSAMLHSSIVFAGLAESVQLSHNYVSKEH